MVATLQLNSTRVETIQEIFFFLKKLHAPTLEALEAEILTSCSPFYAAQEMQLRKHPSQSALSLHNLPSSTSSYRFLSPSNPESSNGSAYFQLKIQSLTEIRRLLNSPISNSARNFTFLQKHNHPTSNKTQKSKSWAHKQQLQEEAIQKKSVLEIIKTLL